MHKQFTLRLMTIDKSGKVWADRRLPFMIASDVGRHIEQIISEYEGIDTIVKLNIFVTLPNSGITSENDNAAREEGN